MTREATRPSAITIQVIRIMRRVWAVSSADCRSTLASNSSASAINSCRTFAISGSTVSRISFMALALLLAKAAARIGRESETVWSNRAVTDLIAGDRLGLLRSVCSTTE
jgi:hypothetical protein